MASSTLVFLFTVVSLLFSVSSSSHLQPDEISVSVASNSPPLSLPLYHIEYFTQSHFKEERSLILARLERDKARKEYLTYVLGEKFEFVTTYLIERMASYVVALRAGNNRQLIYLLFDTGSYLSWWQCSPCLSCFKQDYPMFDTLNSTTLQDFLCSSRLCRYREECISDSDNCPFRIKYLDGDMVLGEMFTDEIFTIHGQQFERDLIFGCAFRAWGHFGRGHPAGILGFDQNELSFPRQMGIQQFSLCPTRPRSKGITPLYFGKVPPVDRNAIKARMLSQSGHYFIELSGVEIANQGIQVDPEAWRVLIDTGTTISTFPPEIYDTLRNNFRKEVAKKRSAALRLPKDELPKDAKSFDTCYRLPRDTSPADVFPSVSLKFSRDEEPLILDHTRTMIDLLDDGGTIITCLAFHSLSIPDSKSNHSISLLGIWQVQGTGLDYDLSDGTISFTPNACS